MTAIYTRPARPPRNRTLGEQVEEWMATWLVDAVTGDPLILTDEQSYFLDLWYAIDDNGRWLYDRGALRRARGTGKSPTAGYLSAAELCGPVRFSHFDDDGFPVGRPQMAPEVQIIATTLEQTKSIMTFALNCWSEPAIEEYGLRIGIEQVIKVASPRGRIKALSNNPRALRGGRPSMIWLEEGSEWVKNNGGHEAWKRIIPNLSKNPDSGRVCELENAYVPGEDSIAERTHVAWLKQNAKPGAKVTILYDSMEADPETTLHDPVSLRNGLREAAGDAHWLDIETLAAVALDPDIPPSQVRREHLNMIVVAEDNIISEINYGRLVPKAPLRPLMPGDRVALGVDPSLSEDDTAVVAFRLDDMSFHVVHHQFKDTVLGNEVWRVDEQRLDDAVRLVHSELRCEAMASDVHPLDDLVATWERDFGEKMRVSARPGHPTSFDMRTNRRELTFAFESMLSMMNQGKVVMSGDPMLRQHFMNAKLRPNPDGNLFGKETRNSPRKVDLVAASLLAHLSGMRLLALGEERPSNIVAHEWGSF